MAERYDVAVVGTGAVGLTAALALARAGRAVCLLGPEPPPGDGRSAALLAPSVDLLRDLDVWPDLDREAGPLRALRIVDDTGSLFRPPPVLFRAAEIGLEAFGWNVENARLNGALAEAVREEGLAWRQTLVTEASRNEGATRLRDRDGGEVEARLVVAADGRNSRLRAAAGIPVRERRYPQVALTAPLAHGRAHEEVSTEFHTHAGPLTLVPLPRRRPSLVWVVSPGTGRRLAALPDAALAAAIEAASHGLLGSVRLDGPRGAVPLGLLTADRFVAPGLALVGEAAHALPPIGAQGLNLGLADVRALAGLLSDPALAADDGPTLARFEAERRRAVGLRAFAVDGLNRALLSAALPVDAVRGLGLGLLARVGPLRRAVMRAGLGGPGPAPETRGGGRAEAARS